MVNVAPKVIIAVAAFRNKTMNMGIPFEISSKGMQNPDKTRSEASGLIEIKKHPGNNTGNSMKQAMKKRTVIEKKVAETLINGENTVHKPISELCELVFCLYERLYSLYNAV